LRGGEEPTGEKKERGQGRQGREKGAGTLAGTAVGKKLGKGTPFLNKDRTANRTAALRIIP